MQGAAPAKKRRLSAMNGISSSLKACSGLPALRASRSASSSACSSMTSASLSSAAWRSAGVVFDQAANALRAAATARSTSSRLEMGSWASSSPVAGVGGARVSGGGGGEDRECLGGGGVDERAIDEVLERGGGSRGAHGATLHPSRGILGVMRL